MHVAFDQSEIVPLTCHWDTWAGTNTGLDRNLTQGGGLCGGLFRRRKRVTRFSLRCNLESRISGKHSTYTDS